VVCENGKVIEKLSEEAQKWELQMKDSFIQTDRK